MTFFVAACEERPQTSSAKFAPRCVEIPDPTPPARKAVLRASFNDIARLCRPIGDLSPSQWTPPDLTQYDYTSRSWHCASNVRQFGRRGRDGERSRLSFVVRGGKEGATDIEVALHLANPADKREARRQMVSVARELAGRLGISLKPEFQKGALNHDGAGYRQEGIEVSATFWNGDERDRTIRIDYPVGRFAC